MDVKRISNGRGSRQTLLIVSLVLASSGFDGDSSEAAAAGGELALRVTEFMAVCGKTCRDMSVRLEVRNMGTQTLCIPDHTVSATLSSFTEFRGPDEVSPRDTPYRGHAPGPFAGSMVGGQDFDFPVYVLNPGRSLELFDSQTNFLDLKEGEPIEGRIKVNYFACGPKAPLKSVVMQSSAQAKLVYEPAYDREQ